MVAGFDFSRTSGMAWIDAAGLKPALRTQMDGVIAQYQAARLLPAGYEFRLPSRTEWMSFSFGPQMTRCLPLGVTPLGNPAIGALRERTTSEPADAFQEAVVRQAMPTRSKLDWTPFFGGTAGVEASRSRHMGVKAQVDVLRSHPFNYLLERGNWTRRYTLGIVLKSPSRQTAVR